MSCPIERIVVRFDGASENRTAIDTAARLAADAEAPLHGVFVEDEDLLRLAHLPFACQVTSVVGAEPLSVRDIELHLHAAAERARHDLAAAAKRHALQWSFEITRGDSDCALSGTTERDLVVSGALTRPIAGDFRVECRCWSSIGVAQGPFLVARHNWNTSGSVVVLLRDRSAGSIRLLDTAAQVAEARGSGLTVICSPTILGVVGVETWIADRLAPFTVRLLIEVMPAEPAALHRRIAELDCHLLAIEADTTEGNAGRLREFTDRLACDVLIVP